MILCTSEPSPRLVLPEVNSLCRNSRCLLSSASFAFFARISSLRACREEDILCRRGLILQERYPRSPSHQYCRRDNSGVGRCGAWMPNECDANAGNARHSRQTGCTSCTRCQYCKALRLISLQIKSVQIYDHLFIISLLCCTEV